MPTQAAGRCVPAALRAAPDPRSRRSGQHRRDGRPGGVHRGALPRASQAAARAGADSAAGRGVRARFGRESGGLVRSYRTEDAETIVVALGSVNGTVQDVVDEMRDDGRARSASWRSARSGRSRSPRCARRCARAKRVVVLEKCLAVGLGGIVSDGVRKSLSGIAAARLHGHRRARRPRDHARVAARAVRGRRARRARAADVPRPRPRDWSSSSSRASAKRAAPGRPPKRILRDLGTVASQHRLRRDVMTQTRSSSTRPARSPSATACSPQDQRSVQADMRRTNSLNSGPPRLPGLRRGARRALCDRRGDAGDGQPADRRQRDRMPRGVLHALSRDVVADPVDPLAVRQRRRGRLGRRRGAAALGPPRRARHRARRRRRHHRHRLRLPVRHVRAQRRRALHLLRQRGVHEHRRAALERDAAGRAHRDHAGGRAASRATSSAPARTCRGSRWRTAFPTSRPRACRQPARPRGARSTLRDGASRGARYIHILVPCPLGWGSASDGHDQDRAARRRDRDSSRCSRRKHGESHVRATQIRQQVPVDRIPEAAEALCAPVRQSAATRAHRAIQAMADRNIAQVRPAATEETHGQAVRHHARPGLEPRQQDRRVAHQAPAVRRSAAAVQSRVPGGREHPGLAVSRGVGRLRGARGAC